MFLLWHSVAFMFGVPWVCCEIFSYQNLIDFWLSKRDLSILRNHKFTADETLWCQNAAVLSVLGAQSSARLQLVALHLKLGF